jgi:cytochrome o ubiquinol oxidase subunit 3
MTTLVTIHQEDHLEVQHEIYGKTIFGFWIYLMTDCVLFATLFATYAVLHNNTFGGPAAHDIFSLPYALTETLILLTSSFTCGVAMLAAYQKKKGLALALFAITFLLGISFLTLELREFSDLVKEGNSWERSAFLSSFFTLVGCHGLHISCGLLWMFVMQLHIVFRGFTLSTLRRLMCLSLFWHFLDVVWVLIFTIVYLMGVK